MAAMVLSVTFVPAAVALFITGRVVERESPHHARRDAGSIEPLLKFALDWRHLVVAARRGLGPRVRRLGDAHGQEFIPSLDEGDIALHALRIPGTA